MILTLKPRDEEGSVRLGWGGTAEMHDRQTALYGGYDDFPTENQFVLCPVAGDR